MTKATITRLTATATALVMTVAALTGCTTAEPPQDPTDTPTVEPTTDTPETPDQTDAPEEEPTVEELAELTPEAGTEVSPEDAERLADGYRTHPMADGTLIAVQDGVELPEVVVADLTAPLIQVAAEDPKNLSGPDPAMMTAMQESRSAVARMGRTAVTVMATYGVGGWQYQVFPSASQPLITPATRSHAEALAVAEAYVAEQADPTKYVIVDTGAQ